jgi:surfeit locus 1 family protein
MVKFIDALTTGNTAFSNFLLWEYFKVFPKMISRRWILTTILVVSAMAVMIRLGIWQLDRLEQRRLFNSRVLAQTSQPALNLNKWTGEEDLSQMEYRQVFVVGEYDHSQEIALRNQHWVVQSGVHLVTPMQISGSDQAVLVDRGWIPAKDFESGDWSAFIEGGKVRVDGIIRPSISKADFGSKNDPYLGTVNDPIKAWNFVTVERIQEQVSQPLVPIYVQQSPDPSWESLPHRSQPELEITEGPHMGYAIQWFTFAAILGLGYPVFILRQSQKASEQISE